MWAKAEIEYQRKMREKKEQDKVRLSPLSPAVLLCALASSHVAAVFGRVAFGAAVFAHKYLLPRAVWL